MTPLRIALVGCGIISAAHLRAYQKLADRATVVACCDLDLEKAGKRAEGIGARVTDDYASLLADPDIDAIDLCTPHHLHAEAAVAAAKAGKHILCQKPMAKTLTDCDAMIDAAKKAGVALFYAETSNAMPAGEEARRLVESGRIGRLIGIQATWAHWQGGEYMSTAWRYDPKITGGGQLLDGGIHYIELMRKIGGPIEAVSCFVTRFREELGGEDTAAMIARYKAGHLGQIFSSQASGIWYPEASFAAIGLEGTLILGGRHGALTLHRQDLPNRFEILIDRDSWSDAFVSMIGNFLDVVQRGVSNPSPGEVGREDLRIVLAAYESARLGREVRLDEMEPHPS